MKRIRNFVGGEKKRIVFTGEQGTTAAGRKTRFARSNHNTEPLAFIVLNVF